MIYIIMIFLLFIGMILFFRYKMGAN